METMKTTTTAGSCIGKYSPRLEACSKCIIQAQCIEQRLANTKVCKECGQIKPLDAYGKLSRNPDGLQRRCKVCINAKAAEFRETHRDEVREYHREYQKGYRAERADDIRAYQRDYHENYRHSTPEREQKYLARLALNNAVDKGRLDKPSVCEACGRAPGEYDLHGHHENYSNPLDVTWLCRDCHTEAHLEMKEVVA